MSATLRDQSPLPVVVGVDGSESSRAALAWAATQARLIGAPLVCVSTWEWPATFGAPIGLPTSVDFEADARSELTQCVDKVLGAGGRDDVVELVVEGHAPQVLEDESKAASLIVVGCRGHGEFTGMLLGSVSGYLATHAHCPVVIVRGDDADAAQR